MLGASVLSALCLRTGPVPGSQRLDYNEPLSGNGCSALSVCWAVRAVWSLHVCGVTGRAQNPCPLCFLAFLQVLSPSRGQSCWQCEGVGLISACDWSCSLGQSPFLSGPQFILWQNEKQKVKPSDRQTLLPQRKAQGSSRTPRPV